MSDSSLDSPNFLTCPGVPELTVGEPTDAMPELPPAGPVKETLPEPEEQPALSPPPPAPPVAPPQEILNPPPLLPSKAKHHWWRWVIAILFLLGLVAVSPLVYGGIRATLAALRIKQAVGEAQADLLSKNFIGAQAAIQRAGEQLTEMQAGLNAVGPWKNIPFVHTQLQALEDTGRAAQTALVGVKDIVDVVASIQDAINLAGTATNVLDTGIAPNRSFRDLTPDEKRAVLAKFNQGLPQLHIARERFRIALEAWQGIPQDQLYAPLRDQLKPFTKILPELQARVDEAISLLDVFLPMAGYPSEKNYLLILQNADEIRPTGGFIGNIGTVTIDAAEMKQIKFQDVYAIDNPVSGVWKEVPPEAIRMELGVNAWFLRDANWSPDFPQSAERIMDYYDRELALASVSHPALNGVIALQPGFFYHLLKLTGPITIDNKEFTADNFYTELEYAVEIGFNKEGKPVEQRKEIVNKLGDEIMSRLIALPSSRWGDLLDLFTQALDQKDILLYERDPAILSFLDAHKWSGRTQPSAPDYLWVVDANLAALKTDGVMNKTIRYSVDMTDPNGPTATVTLHYTNTHHTIDWRYTRYRDYVRVYVPEGSTLVSSNGAMLNDITKTGGHVIPGKVDVFHDLGKVGFGAFWSIEPGETRDLRFTYRLSQEVVSVLQSGSYKLLVQKQPGNRSQLTLDLLFGKKLSSAMPAESQGEYGDNRYRVSLPLDKDQKIEVGFISSL